MCWIASSCRRSSESHAVIHTDDHTGQRGPFLSSIGRLQLLLTHLGGLDDRVVQVERVQHSVRAQSRRDSDEVLDLELRVADVELLQPALARRQQLRDRVAASNAQRVVVEVELAKRGVVPESGAEQAAALATEAVPTQHQLLDRARVQRRALQHPSETRCGVQQVLALVVRVLVMLIVAAADHVVLLLAQVVEAQIEHADAGQVALEHGGSERHDVDVAHAVAEALARVAGEHEAPVAAALPLARRLGAVVFVVVVFSFVVVCSAAVAFFGFAASSERLRRAQHSCDVALALGEERRDLVDHVLARRDAEREALHLVVVDELVHDALASRWQQQQSSRQQNAHQSIVTLGDSSRSRRLSVLEMPAKAATAAASAAPAPKAAAATPSAKDERPEDAVASLHTDDEQVSVRSGTFSFGDGAKYSKSAVDERQSPCPDLSTPLRAWLRV